MVSDSPDPDQAGPDQRQAEREADPLAELAEMIDRSTGAAIARFTGGLAPTTLGEAFADWATHLTASPGRRLHLAAEAGRKAMRLADYCEQLISRGAKAEPCVAPSPQDHRFADPAWQHWPYNIIHQAFLLNQQWWDDACRGIGGVTARHEAVLRFAVRQMLDMVSPSNFAATNPLLQRRLLESGGECLANGAFHLAEDLLRGVRHEPPAGAEHFRVGVDVAVTPGRVVHRNALIELIQYAPATDRVRPEPLLLVPSWIMKYYILDLSSTNSLVRYLVARGYSVFVISWRNPGPDDRHLGMEEYRRLGVAAALDAVMAISGARAVHMAGYCLGGTLLAIAAAAAARDGDERFHTLSLFASQTDFSEPGEFGLFVDPAHVALLESMMWQQGYLDSQQMVGAYQMLHSKDLIWSRLIREYLMGGREPMTDLMAWGADGARMPHAMHSTCLRALFLNNDLARGRHRVDGRPISLGDISAPAFVVGIEQDHVAPWQSVHRIHLLTDTELTFLLTSGDHHTGIVADPGHAKRHYRLMTRAGDGASLDPDIWYEQADEQPGLWWPEWADWLDRHSGPLQPPPPLGNAERGFPALEPAPGTYVHQK
ncbi:poly-beta-hydroxybutyrate polymerase [Sphingomonas oleivorans]|uniref:Poly-beta-hydroxybutyrate polymerase n=1 Tax=Sphingomonas oleivorans TaxID=1735121 RepID=A0A2T5FYH0_9SPHN|nr:alpha/beta fold hydrolase [Sphingomonas oleivorans]PTQ11588.1 poly-beta-hydroxybutyrate polymerase [Sphingomonas oleivorans]